MGDGKGDNDGEDEVTDEDKNAGSAKSSIKYNIMIIKWTYFVN